MKVVFDVLHLYYLPQYLPVQQELLKHQIHAEFVFYHSNKIADVTEAVIELHQLRVHWVDNEACALRFYQQYRPDWLIIGNQKKQLDSLPVGVKTALMQHGIGPKSCYYDVSEQPTTVRFVEGQHRLRRLQQRFPTATFIDTGYAKLDPIINAELTQLSLEQLGLDPDKPTILYSPTFYPSSLECFPDDFARDFAEFNLIIKPHYFSLTKENYQNQRQLLQRWGELPNVYLAPIIDYNLLPFMQLANVMISDASSAIFEFAALGKPVIWCNFYKLRWSYRSIFSFRLNRRLDSDISYFKQLATEVSSYKQLKQAVTLTLQSPQTSASAKALIYQLAGEIDGQCSKRIVNVLLTKH